MTQEEIVARVEQEIKRAKVYRNPLEDSPFAGLGADPEYVRGGIDALEGLLRWLLTKK